MFKQWINKMFHDNNGKLIIIGLIALFIIIILMALSKMNIIGSSVQTKSIPSVYNPSKTVIAGENISQKEYEEDENIVEQFVKYCNNGKYEEAYNLLTDECKDALYPNLDKFINAYINTIFNGNMEYNIQSWVNNQDYTTYKIRYIEDSLSTGNYSDSKKFEDYITVVNLEHGQKININGYIGKMSIFKETKTDKFEIVVENADVYLERIEYTLRIKNKTKNEIQLDGLRDSRVMIGLKVNETVYRANKYKLNKVNLTLSPGAERKIKLEFANNYGSGNLGDQILFYDVILDTIDYSKNRENYDNTEKITVSL